MQSAKILLSSGTSAYQKTSNRIALVIAPTQNERKARTQVRAFLLVACDLVRGTTSQRELWNDDGS